MYSAGSIFTRSLFQSKQLAFLLMGRCEAGKIWSCVNPIAVPNNIAVSSLLCFLFTSWGLIFCQRSILFEWLSNACAGGRSEEVVESGATASSSGFKIIDLSL